MARFVWGCFLLILAQAVVAGAQENGARVYRLGLPDVPGLMFRNEDGSVGGFAPQVLEQAAEDEGFEVVWIDGSWPELFEALKKGEIDALPNTQVTEEREEYLDYCENGLYTMWSEFYLREGEEFGSINDLRDKRIGLVRHDNNAAGFVKYVAQFDLEYQPVYFDSHVEAADALHRGEIYGLAGPTPVMLGDLFTGLHSAGIYYNPTNLNIGFPKGKDPAFREAIDRRLGLYKQDPDSIYNRLYREYDLAEMRPARQHIPRWILWTVGTLAVSVLVFTASSLILRRLVAVRTKELSEANAKLQDYSENLESKVAEKTAEVERKHQNLREAHDQLQRTQDQLIQSEKMATLGRLAATFAHEINSPLGAIGSTADTIALSLDDIDASFGKLGTWLCDPETASKLQSALLLSQQYVAGEVSRKESRSRQETMAKMLAEAGLEEPEVTARKLANASLFVTNADEILTLLSHDDADEMLQFIQRLSNIRQGTKVMRTAVGLMTRTITSLKNYARRESSGEFVPIDIVKSLETVLLLYQAKNAVKLKLEHGVDVPLVEADADAIQQVWTNLVHNALQSMQFSGQLTVRISQRNGGVAVAVSDTGCGISEDIRDKIFEPLFTTKPSGEGCGLGLDIVQRIVQRHHGELTFETVVGGGTTFTVWLPVEQPKVVQDVGKLTFMG